MAVLKYCIIDRAGLNLWLCLEFLTWCPHVKRLSAMAGNSSSDHIVFNKSPARTAVSSCICLSTFSIDLLENLMYKSAWVPSPEICLSTYSWDLSILLQPLNEIQCTPVKWWSRPVFQLSGHKVIMAGRKAGGKQGAFNQHSNGCLKWARIWTLPLGITTTVSPLVFNSLPCHCHFLACL